MKANPGWSTPSELRQQVTRRWDQLLSALALGEEFTPLRLRLKCPSSSELSEHFADVQDWIERLKQKSEDHGYRIVWKEINLRVLGPNRLPDQVWVDTLEDAAILGGSKSEIATLNHMIEITRLRFPELIPWLGRYPRKALGINQVWPLLLSIVGWRREHPRPNVYLRQVDLPGVHSKLIEEHRGILAELFDIILPPEEVDRTISGVGNFCKRYGFRDKSLFVRFRPLDPAITVLASGGMPDITVPSEDMARLHLQIKRVFIIENEVTYLAFPPVRDSIAIFGAGYCFDNLKPVEWLKQKNVFYWGDIDTHGFSILDQLRAILPAAISFFMDCQTLLMFRDFWVIESSQKISALKRLTDAEDNLYADLCNNSIGFAVRLEQERIPLSYIQKHTEITFLPPRPFAPPKNGQRVGTNF